MTTTQACPGTYRVGDALWHLHPVECTATTDRHETHYATCTSDGHVCRSHAKEATS